MLGVGISSYRPTRALYMSKYGTLGRDFEVSKDRHSDSLLLH